MKPMKILAAVVVSACLSTTAVPVFSDIAREGAKTGIVMRDKHHKGKEFMGDPVKMLEKRKEQVQQLLKDGKITKEKADALTQRIDAKLAEIREFNKLPPDQKKEKLINDFKARIEKKVKDGRLSREEADKRIGEFTNQVKNWDGNGYPDFWRKGLKHGGRRHCR